MRYLFKNGAAYEKVYYRKYGNPKVEGNELKIKEESQSSNDALLTNCILNEDVSVVQYESIENDSSIINEQKQLYNDNEIEQASQNIENEDDSLEVIQNQDVEPIQKSKKSSFKHLRTLVAMQLRDKLNIELLNNKKEFLRQLLFMFLKFVIVAGVTFGLLAIFQKFGLFYYSESKKVMILIVTVSLVLSTISCTKDLMMNLYFSDDNKVLITLPVDSNVLFISKLVVFFFYELKRSFGFLIPITLGCVIQLYIRGFVSPWIFLWMWFPMLLIVALPVVLGAVLSIPSMYVYRFIKRYTITQIVLFTAVLVGFTYGCIVLIDLIPSNINLLQQWEAVKRWINNFLIQTEYYLVPTREIVKTIVGEQTSEAAPCFYNWLTAIKFVCFLGVDLVLLTLSYLLSRPLFFKMMAKNFEMNKSITLEHKNRHHGKYFTFVNKELKINLRTLSISINYIMVYIIVPIMVLLLNALYKVMATNYRGDVLKCTFNVLIICLPMLASNAMVATYYSKEGRAGYLKRVKPIYALYPLLTKLFFNIVLSIPSVLISAFIFGHASGFDVGATLLIYFGILFVHVGHMIWSATLDIMNPLNEQYATTGVTVDNPNENKSTLFAFIISFVYAFLAFFFIYEAGRGAGDFTSGLVRLFVIGLIFIIASAYLFVCKVRAYYYDNERR